MLGKMMIHGLVAALLIGGAAAVYAQASAGGTATPAAPAGNGYLQPGTDGTRMERDRTGKDGRKHADRKMERHDGQPDGRRTGQDKLHGHDD